VFFVGSETSKPYYPRRKRVGWCWIDPLGIHADAATIYRNASNGWTLDKGQALMEKNQPKLFGDKGKPSEINHGNVLPSITAEDGAGGAHHARHAAV
jgi:CRISPR-associated protein Csb1